jgi:hypothetical protein
MASLGSMFGAGDSGTFLGLSSAAADDLADRGEGLGAEPLRSVAGCRGLNALDMALRARPRNLQSNNEGMM